MSFAASTSSVPLGTCTCTPSIVTVTKSTLPPRYVAVHSCFHRFANDPRLELLGEALEDRQQKRFDGIAERTQIDAGDLMADAVEHLDVRLKAVTFDEAMQHGLEPVTALAARRALAARLVCEEPREVVRRADEIRRVVHDDHRAGTEHRSGFGERFVVVRQIQMLLENACR